MATKDFTVSACLPAIYTGGNYTNPGDLHLPIGKWAAGTGQAWSTRALLKASISFAGMSSITSASLRLSMHTASGWHCHGSGVVAMKTQRKTQDWSESSGGGSTATDETWGGSAGNLVDANMTDDGDGEHNVDNNASDGSVDTLDITKAVRAWYGGSPNYGLCLMTGGGEADNANEAAEFYSRRKSGEGPVIRIDYTTNTAPNAPTGLSPVGSNTYHVGRSIAYQATRDDPDSGDYISAYDIEVFAPGGSPKLIDYTGYPSGSPTSFSKTLTLPDGYDANAMYEWRCRTRDKADVWGGWSPNRAYRLNSVPDTPPAPTVDTDTLTPTISGTFSDPDPGDAPAFGEVHVETTATATDVWLSGPLPITGTPWSKVYAGAPLAYGTEYRARVRTTDSYGGVSAWGAWRVFTPLLPSGPDLCTPRTTATKSNTLTPTLTVAASFTFRNDQLEVYAANSLSSTKLWTKPWAGADYAAATSKPSVYAGAALAWGGTYYWRAQVEDAAGLVGAWTALMPFYVNAEPSAPSSLAARTAATAAPVLNGGVYLVTTATPRLEAEYHDPDLESYADRPSSRTVEIYARNADGSAGALVKADTLASPPYTVPFVFVYPASPALVLGSSYLVRWRFTDNAGRVGPWSTYMTMRYTAGPAIALVSPAAGAIVTDQTPLVAWDYSSPTGKVQAGFRVELFDRGPAAAPGDESLVHDSGDIAGSVESYQVPAGIVLDDRAYRWQVTVADSDGLVAVLA